MTALGVSAGPGMCGGDVNDTSETVSGIYIILGCFPFFILLPWAYF